MPISSVSSQALQTMPGASAFSGSSYSAEPVTSDDPSVLTQQEKTVQSEIAQLQQNHGDTRTIEALNQELQTIQQDLRQARSQPTTADAAQIAAAQPAGLDIRA